MTMNSQTLFHSNAFTCFIDKELLEQHELTLVKKTTLVIIEVSNDWNLSLGPMTHETKVLEINIGLHLSKVVFNVISSLTNPIIIGLF